MMKTKTKDLLKLYSIAAVIFSALVAIDCYSMLTELMIQIGGVSIASVSLLIAMLHSTQRDVYAEERKMAFKIALFFATTICLVIFG